MNAFYWLLVFVVMLVIEIISLGLTTIWFAGGALVAFAASLLGAGIGIQILLFFVVSIVLLIFTRPFAVKYINKDRIKTNAESLIGKRVVVTETIDNLNAKGKVDVAGLEWTARNKQENEIILKDKVVTILEISGVKLIVSETEER